MSGALIDDDDDDDIHANYELVDNFRTRRVRVGLIRISSKVLDCAKALLCVFCEDKNVDARFVFKQTFFVASSELRVHVSKTARDVCDISVRRELTCL